MRQPTIDTRARDQEAVAEEIPTEVAAASLVVGLEEDVGTVILETEAEEIPRIEEVQPETNIIIITSLRTATALDHLLLFTQTKTAMQLPVTIHNHIIIIIHHHHDPGIIITETR